MKIRNSNQHSKSFVNWALLVFFTILLLELVSFLGVTAVSRIRPDYVVDRHIQMHFADLDVSHVTRFMNEMYDPILGWDVRPNTTLIRSNTAGEQWTSSYGFDGSRNNDLLPSGYQVATYGDSYTHGHEVNDNETWQYYLSLATGSGIKNYGVGAYGTRQAILKLKRHIDDGLVFPITILGIYKNNLERSANSFRPFLKKQTGFLIGFKPSIRVLDGQVEYFVNPNFDGNSSISSLKGKAKGASFHDYWTEYKLNQRFPYVLQVFRAIQLLINLERYEKPRTIWKDPEGMQIMQHLIADFYEIVKSSGSKPIVLFIPGHRELITKKPRYREFRDFLRREYQDLKVIDIVEHEVDTEKFWITPKKGHTSPYGNKKIAEILESELDWKSVVTE